MSSLIHTNFRKPSVATDSEMTDDDIIIRYDGEEIIGFSVLKVSAIENEPPVSVTLR